MNILVTGSHGFIGTALIKRLRAAAFHPIALQRSPSTEQEARTWDPANNSLNPDVLQGIDAVIHLAGESIADQRWTPTVKSRIFGSRVNATTLLAQTIAQLPDPPQVVLTASAIGFYGNRGTELLDERSAPGSLFLSTVCQAWEEATNPLQLSQVRVAHLRFGLVLDPSGGALQKLLPPFKLGLGGKVGPGNQYMSWISLRDAVSAIIHCLKTKTLKGPVNIVSPAPVTNLEFTATLAAVLNKPAFLTLPTTIAELVFGEMARNTILASTRVTPKKLQETGFLFDDSSLRPALSRMLNN